MDAIVHCTLVVICERKVRAGGEHGGQSVGWAVQFTGCGYIGRLGLHSATRTVAVRGIG